MKDLVIVFRSMIAEDSGAGSTSVHWHRYLHSSVAMAVTFTGAQVQTTIYTYIILRHSCKSLYSRSAVAFHGLPTAT